jgi:hypothetical protein
MVNPSDGLGESGVARAAGIDEPNQAMLHSFPLSIPVEVGNDIAETL